MPSLYIILEKKIADADTYVNGDFLSKRNDEREEMAKRLEVRTLMSFFSTSRAEVESMLGEEAGSLGNNIEEKWFAAEEGLRTVNALLGNLKDSKLGDVACVEAELHEFVSVLETC